MHSLVQHTSIRPKQVLRALREPLSSWLVYGHDSLQLVWEHMEHATCPALVRDSPPLAEL